jgi:hypothetical protein
MTFRKPGFFGYGSDYDKHKANLSRAAVNLQRGLNAGFRRDTHQGLLCGAFATNLGINHAYCRF